MNVGLIAQDSRKKLMQNFCIAYRSILSKHHLFATGSTGRLIEEVTGLSICKFLEGGLGGAEQLANQISENDIDLVIYFRDPNAPREEGPVIARILYFCDQYSIPLAMNLATAELLIKSLDYGDLEWREAYH